jgi:hypothetical protein
MIEYNGNKTRHNITTASYYIKLSRAIEAIFIG